MAKFNQRSTGSQTVNRAGGDAYKQSPDMQLVSLLLTSFTNDQFYRSEDQTYQELINLITSCDKEFVAKAGIFTRNEFGMRSITHVLTAALAQSISGKPWAKSFYEKIIYRPDDMTEIMSLMDLENGAIPNAMKKGFAAAFNKFDAYQLAKYRSENAQVKLVDVVNLIHPSGNRGNKQALKELIKGTLKSTGTWEAKLSAAGEAKDTTKAKADAWKELILEKKIGYFALLRNLRNILQQAPELVPNACELLCDRKLIKKSLVLPFRYFTAIQELEKESNSRDIIMALSDAAEISLDNVPKFDGKMLIAVDVSGSMGGRPQEIARMFGSVLYKSNDSMILTFDSTARFISLNPRDSILSLMKGIRFSGGGTNFNAIFDRCTQPVDRVVILSDMQPWIKDAYWTANPKDAFKNYKKRTNCNPIVYSFDLQGYGSLQFPENNVYCLSGFSDKIFDIMKVLETDKKALLKKINKIIL